MSFGSWTSRFEPEISSSARSISFHRPCSSLSVGLKAGTDQRDHVLRPDSRLGDPGREGSRGDASADEQRSAADVAAEAHQLAPCARRTAAPGFIRPSRRSTICAAPLRRAQVAELDPGDLAAGLDDVEPHHFAGLEIDQRRVIELGRAADIGRAEADEAAGKPDHAERDAPRRGDLVLGVKEQAHNRSRSSARAAPRPRRASSRDPCRAWSADNRRDICGGRSTGRPRSSAARHRQARRPRRPASSLRRSMNWALPPRVACCARSAAMMLVRAWSVQSARGSTIPPVVSDPTVTSGRSTSSL